MDVSEFTVVRERNRWIIRRRGKKRGKGRLANPEEVALALEIRRLREEVDALSCRLSASEWALSGIKYTTEVLRNAVRVLRAGDRCASQTKDVRAKTGWAEATDRLRSAMRECRDATGIDGTEGRSHGDV